MDHQPEPDVRTLFARLKARRADLSPALEELESELLDAFTPETARHWLFGEVSSLGGRRPIDLIDSGNVEPVSRILIRLNAGIFT